MRSIEKRIQLWDVAPRIFADYAIIHCAMLLAFAISAIYQARGETLSYPLDVTGNFRQYYLRWFLILSLLFPAIFYLNGIYTHVRFYAAWRKLYRVVLAVLMALAAFITANFFLVQAKNPLGRTAALVFVPLAILGLVGIRVAKEWLVGEGRAERETGATGSEGGLVLVIGGAGYIGCWLVRRLLEEGRRVRVLDNAVYGLDPIQDLLLNPRLEYENGDCRNIQDVVKAMRGVSSVVHLAAIVGDPACEIDRTTTIEINYAATRMLVEIAKGYGVERFVFASSCSVYGASSECMTESSPVKPISLYGETKVASERALLEAGDENFHPVLLRFATVFGLSNRPRFDLVVNLLSAKACQDGVITIYNGEQWRPFVHVKDLAEATILVLHGPLSLVSRQIFNVGDNRLNLRLSGVAAAIKQAIPSTVVEYVENSDRRNYRVSFDKIEKRLGFRCRYTLEDGIREIKAAFDSNEIVNYKNVRFSNVVFLKESGTPGNKKEIDRAVMAAFGGEAVSRQTQLQNSKAKSAAASS
jgi:nucleoside-diphosphate-sugar epimerase